MTFLQRSLPSDWFVVLWCHRVMGCDCYLFGHQAANVDGNPALSPAVDRSSSPLVFAAPVVDEVIAYPQMKALCKTVEHVEYDPKTATGQTVSKYSSVIGNEKRTLFPGILVRIERRALVTPFAEVPIVKWASIEPQAGFLQFPAGSSGGSMPLLLADCGFTARDSERFLKVVTPLKLVKTEYQPTK